MDVLVSLSDAALRSRGGALNMPCNPGLGLAWDYISLAYP